MLCEIWNVNILFSYKFKKQHKQKIIYRGEFDPYFPNRRQGWHKRALCEYCKKIMDEFNSLNFNDFSELIKDTTYLGCGFDFKLLLKLDFYCVEVKGLNLNTGNIVMTEKEYVVARELQDKYCLFIVKNFIKKPNHQIIFNPINSGLNFKRTEKAVVQINYTTSL